MRLDAEEADALAAETQESLETSLEESEVRNTLYKSQVDETCTELEGIKANLGRVELENARLKQEVIDLKAKDHTGEELELVRTDYEGREAKLKDQMQELETWLSDALLTVERFRGDATAMKVLTLKCIRGMFVMNLQQKDMAVRMWRQGLEAWRSMEATMKLARQVHDLAGVEVEEHKAEKGLSYAHNDAMNVS